MEFDEARVLQAQLKAVHRRLRRQMSGVEGLSSSAVRSLGVLAKADRPLAPGELAGELDMATSNVAAALRELEQAGYVRRSRNADDKRRVDVRITERGGQVVDEHIEQRSQWLRTAIDATCDPDEQRILCQAGVLLGRVAAWGESGVRA